MTALGLALLAIGTIAVVAESHVPSLGVIGGPGVAALGVGAILAVGGLGGGLALALVVALATVVASATVVGISVRKGVAVRRRRVRAGPERLVGHVGVVRSWSEPAGTVQVDGAIWRARRSWGDEEDNQLRPGDPVTVEHLNGLTLYVRRAETWELTR
jgi:membrane-bound serine protease (ClpP class)